MSTKLLITDIFLLNDGRTILTGRLTQDLDQFTPKSASLLISKEVVGVIQINWEAPLNPGDPSIKSVSTTAKILLTKSQIAKGDVELEFLE